MHLSDAYAAWLRDGTAPATLAGALRAHGYALEAALLDRWAAGEPETVVDVDDLVWSGRRATIAPTLPEHASAGDLWLDLRELVPMLLLGRDLPDDLPEHLKGQLPPFVGWIALRPVARWQFAGMLEVAPIAARVVQIEPPLATLDRARLLRGPEDQPVRGALADEALLYASWFGKSLADSELWQAANAQLTREELAALWGPLGREWGDSVDEGVRAVISRETADEEPSERYEEDPDDGSFFGDWGVPEDAGFRTAVNAQLGLRPPVGDPLSVLDVKLEEGVSRA
jgi:hypothetical protein